MRFLDRIFKRSTVNTAHPRDPVLAEWFSGGSSPAVSPRSALGIPAVYACVNVLSETVSSLPLGVWAVNGDVRTSADEHPLQPLLKGRPYPYMTSVEWVEWLVASTALRGDSFVRIVSDARGKVRSLPPMRFEETSVEMVDDKVRYRYGANGDRRILQDDEVLRIPWKIQPDGSSLSPIGLQRESFGMALSARRYQARLLDNNSAPKGAVKLDNALSDEAVEALIESWERRHRGPDNAGRIAVFDGGMDWVSIGMSNEDAQFAELMQMSIRDTARVFRVQPHKIGDLANATFSNIEHQSIEFMTDTILPWVRRLEARMEGWLLNDAERGKFSIEFNMQGMLRGDATARANLYKTLFYTSAISPNEIRRMEGLNPIDGGDTFYVQGATVPVQLLDQILVNDTPASEMPRNGT